MNTCTALILVPQPDQLHGVLQRIRPCTVEELEETLETTGPSGRADVHHHIGFCLPVMSFDQFKTGRPDAPKRQQRSPESEPGWYVDQLNVTRIVNLLDTMTAGDAVVMRQIAEIRYRVLTLCPLHI